MTLSPGARLGTYEITGAIGAGGMGEVFRARDTKLDRDVAIKVLPSELAQDRERLTRFEREAKLLASLNHSNIAHVYGFESATLPDGSAAHFLAMELVEGEDLAERLKRGAIPGDEAIAIAKQIAEGLEEAHEHGIIHRDLKPANIKVTHDGKVKVLDFGLAKALEGSARSAAVSGSTQLSHSPTMSRHMTEAGMIMGTAAYMSPEQARGKPVDKRADIWAFGVVLHEMLTGERLFAGETVSDVLASVLKTEIDFGRLPESTPGPIRALVRRCLERQPRSRLHDIADARIVFDELIAGRTDESSGGHRAAPPPAIATWRSSVPWIVAALGLAVGVLGTMRAGRSSESSTTVAPVSKLMIPLPEDAPLHVRTYPGRALAMSRDGRQIVYTTSGASPDTRIRLRRLDETEIRVVTGSEGGAGPFLSPDGEWIGFFVGAEAALKKIPVGGGRPITLARGFANAAWMLGEWCDDGTIVFDTWNGGLRAVSGDGGEVRVLTEPKDEWHLDPQPLPGPCKVLFFTYGEEGEAVEAISVKDGVRTRILENASHARYLESGHLLFMRDGTPFMAAFNAALLKVKGPASPLPFAAVTDAVRGRAPNPQLAVSRGGTLVYAPVDESVRNESPLASFSLAGQVEEVAALPFVDPKISLSPLGDRLAMSGRAGGRARITALDLKRKATTPLVELDRVDAPAEGVWTPDGRAILYSRYGPFEGEVVRHMMDGTTPDEVLVQLPGTWFCPWSISPDGRFLVFSLYDFKTGADLWLLDLQAPKGSNPARVFIATRASDHGAAISPNGAWIAYYSDESGTGEILLDKFPERGQKTRVATGEVDAPVWSPDGRELYFATGAAQKGDSGRTMMAARIDPKTGMVVSPPRKLFSGAFLSSDDMGRAYVTTPDGRGFLAVQPPQGQPPLSWSGGWAKQLVVVQNWFTELKLSAEKKAP